MDAGVPGLSEWLLAQGPAGAVIAYLIWKIRDVEERLQKCQEARMSDMTTVTGEVRAAFATSTEVLRANTEVQEKSTGSVSRFGEQLGGFQSSLDRMRDTIERGPWDRGRERQS